MMSRNIQDLVSSWVRAARGNLDELGAALVQGVEDYLGPGHRQELPAGSMFLREGQPVNRIWIVVEGEIRMTRVIGGRARIFHRHSVGPIVGLMAMAQ